MAIKAAISSIEKSTTFPMLAKTNVPLIQNSQNLRRFYTALKLGEQSPKMVG
jgi:hypothetical protein